MVPVIFLFVNYCWDYSDRLNARVMCVLPNRKIANTEHQVIFLSQFYENDPPRVILTSCGVSFVSTVLAFDHHLGTTYETFPSEHANRKSKLFYEKWSHIIATFHRTDHATNQQETVRENKFTDLRRALHHVVDESQREIREKMNLPATKFFFTFALEFRMQFSKLEVSFPFSSKRRV